MTRVICLSDIHGLTDRLVVPDGDVLLIAGDLTSRGTAAQVTQVNAWLGTLSHANKVVIAGNHDFLFERQPELARSLLTNAIYLQDSETMVAGLRIYGAPWQPRFFDWAFNLNRGADLKAKWDCIPAGTDVLITHGPPVGILDRVVRDRSNVGCEDLLQAVKRVRPTVHLFGHIHEGYGVHRTDDTLFVNASTCTLQYHPTNLPVVLDFDAVSGEVVHVA